ncbi:MAG: DNA-directed RNA polymerase subunit omega [Eubacteriales bacterium]|nr:DNA-directed RNA polymerase subunit omega [Eubacteriales bacterium]NCC81208.1 DNA-directed RNA polymerase subunit omega [Clostridia bacterium]
MNRPYIDDLLKRVDSKYSLIIAAARRARQIVDGDSPLVDVEKYSNKSVTMALNEINEEKIIVVR